MDFKIKTKRGVKEFKDVSLTIRNYYDLKKANMPFENLQKICEEEDFLAIAEMLEIILKKYGMVKGDIADAPLSEMANVVNILVGLTTEGSEGLTQDGESTGE